MSNRDKLIELMKENAFRNMLEECSLVLQKDASALYELIKEEDTKSLNIVFNFTRDGLATVDFKVNKVVE